MLHSGSLRVLLDPIPAILVWRCHNTMDNQQVLAGPHRNKQSSAVTPKDNLELLVSLMSRCRRSVGGSQDTETQSMQTQGEHRISTTALLWGDSDYFPSIAVLTPSSNPSAVWTPPHFCRETRSVSHSFHLPSILLWCCRRRYVSQGSTTQPHPRHPSPSFPHPATGDGDVSGVRGGGFSHLYFRRWHIAPSLLGGPLQHEWSHTVDGMQSVFSQGSLSNTAN